MSSKVPSLAHHALCTMMCFLFLMVAMTHAKHPHSVWRMQRPVFASPSAKPQKQENMHGSVVFEKFTTSSLEPKKSGTKDHLSMSGNIKQDLKNTDAQVHLSMPGKTKLLGRPRPSISEQIIGKHSKMPEKPTKPAFHVMEKSTASFEEVHLGKSNIAKLSQTENGQVVKRHQEQSGHMNGMSKGINNNNRKRRIGLGIALGVALMLKGGKGGKGGKGVGGGGGGSGSDLGVGETPNDLPGSYEKYERPKQTKVKTPWWLQSPLWWMPPPPEWGSAPPSAYAPFYHPNSLPPPPDAQQQAIQVQQAGNTDSTSKNLAFLTVE